MIATFASPARAASIWDFGRFEIRRASRNRRYLILSVGFPLAFYLLYTGVLQGGGTARDATLIDGIAWPAFFMVSMAAYGALVATLNWSRMVATERSNGWTRQLQAMPLDSKAYLVTKLVVSFLTTLPAVMLILGTGALLNHVALTATTWLELLLVLTIGSLPFAALGLLLGYLLDGDSVQGGTIVVMFALAILGGMWAPVQSFPAILVTIAHVLPSYHFANLGWDALAGNPIDPADVVVLAAYTAAFGALVIWRFLADEQRAHA
jgi:ABC-2 type transport system permease protein